MVDKGSCDDGFIWNPSTWECDKSEDVGGYLDYLNCKCRKRLIDKLVEKCSEDIDGNEMVFNVSYELVYNTKACKSCVLYVILLIIACIIIMGISGTYFF